jgi:hypothetical protein
MKLYFLKNNYSKILLSFLMLLFSSVTWAGAFEAGMDAIEREDYDKGFRFLCFAINEGDKRALREHSRFLYAEGLDRDFLNAKKCYLEALKKGMVEVVIELGFINYVGYGGEEPDFLQSYIYFNISLINKFNYRGLTARDVEKHLETMRPLLEEREIKFANKIARICYPRLTPACTIPKSKKQREQLIDRVNSSPEE